MLDIFCTFQELEQMRKRIEDNHQGQSASQKVEDKLKVRQMFLILLILRCHKNKIYVSLKLSRASSST